ncbi:hypothetical protein CALVIDRAFT_535856, partial [Calocera viscosa TUFC12733]
MLRMVQLFPGQKLHMFKNFKQKHLCTFLGVDVPKALLPSTDETRDMIRLMRIGLQAWTVELRLAAVFARQAINRRQHHLNGPAQM